jgi:glycosyltransferase involved in cell wall biosynthesis
MTLRPDEPRIAIVVCTFRREKLLGNLLLDLCGQVRQAGCGARSRILVVDNDAEESARVVVQSTRSLCSEVELSYLPVPERGVGNARNAAFRALRANEWLIFFDDDQIPSTHWLATFLSIQKEGKEGMWVGPVTPVFTAPIPPWGKDGWAWGATRSRYPDGASRSSA